MKIPNSSVSLNLLVLIIFSCSVVLSELVHMNKIYTKLLVLKKSSHEVLSMSPGFSATRLNLRI